MQQRKFGKDGPMVGAIGLGCWSFAGAYGPTDEAESHRTLAKALELGVTHIDTANVYGAGVSEKAIGSFIKNHPGRFTIATKGGITRTPDFKTRYFDNSPEHLRAELEKSLARLGVDHVDLYYIHRREGERPIEEVMETLLEFKKEGKIGGIGFSEIAPYSLRAASKVGYVRAVQSEYSLWTRMPELGMIQACKELETTFVPFSPLGRGVFGAQSPNPDKFGDNDFRRGTPRFSEPNFSRNIAAIEPFKVMAGDLGLTSAQLALAWVLHRGDHLIPIPGTRSAEHLEELAKAADVQLSESQMEEISRILPPGFAYGDRYSQKQSVGAERYC